MARKLDALEILDAPNRSVWRDWLAAHHTRLDGIWLILYKKASGRRQMTYADAVEEALCFGWIDSAPRKVDEATYQLYFSPRKKGSVWSGVNKKRVAELLAAGTMRPAGQAKIDAAQLDGSWATLDAVDALEMPPDLAAAMAANETARAHYDAFPPSARKQILQQLAAAKRPETRRQRIERIVEKAAQNLRF